MRVHDKYVGDHIFASRAMVALQEGPTLVSFPDLDDFCQLGVVIGPGAGAGLPGLQDDIIEEQSRVGTRFAAGRVVLTPVQRKIVATAFAYLIKGQPRPANIVATAAPLCGKSEQIVKKHLSSVMKKVNLERWGPKFDSYEDVGYYLIHLSRTIGWEDLPEHLR
jgi:hypothetical protein